MGYFLQQTSAMKMRQTIVTSAHATVMRNKIVVVGTLLEPAAAGCSVGLELVGIKGTAAELLCDSAANTRIHANATRAHYKLIKPRVDQKSKPCTEITSGGLTIGLYL